MKIPTLLTVLIASVSAAATAPAAPATTHILLLAGQPSHGPGEHEHNAGVLLLKKCLDASGLPLTMLPASPTAAALLDPA